MAHLHAKVWRHASLQITCGPAFITLMPTKSRFARATKAQEEVRTFSDNVMQRRTDCRGRTIVGLEGLQKSGSPVMTFTAVRTVPSRRIGNMRSVLIRLLNVYQIQLME